jgi:large subunit ribosomal protein L10
VPNIQKKQEAVDQLTEQIGRAQITVLADYRGLTVSDMAVLRGRLRDAGAEFHVAKNTLTRRAAERLGCDELVPYLVGPTGLAFGYGDPTALAKALTEYARVSRIFAVKGGLLGNRVLPAADVGRLADLPSREVLLARVVGGVQAPIYGLVGVLGGTLRNLVGVLEARRQQLEQAGNGAT